MNHHGKFTAKESAQFQCFSGFSVYPDMQRCYGKVHLIRFQILTIRQKSSSRNLNSVSHDISRKILLHLLLIDHLDTKPYVAFIEITHCVDEGKPSFAVMLKICFPISYRISTHR